MSVKLKIIFGFFIILCMVTAQAVLIIHLNDKKDVLYREILSLYQLNITLKDRLGDINNLERDLTNLISTNAPIPKGEVQNTLSCYYISRNMNQWYNAFTSSAEFEKLDNSMKQVLFDYKKNLQDISDGIEYIRKIDVNKTSERYNAYTETVYPAVSRINILTKDFIGLNSLFFASKNKSMIIYSERIWFFQFIIIAAAILIIIFATFYSNYLLKPLSWLSDGVQRITKGELSFKVKKRSNDELGRLAEHFNIMGDEVKNHREHLEELVSKRTFQLLVAKEELEKINSNLHITNKNLEDAKRIMELDMQMAINVQSSLFMKKAPVTEGWDISFYFKPMSGVSGDMYDFYVDGKGKLLGLTLMDVSGHGVASGLVTMIAKSIAARLFYSQYNVKLNDVVKNINEELIGELGNIDNYLTGIVLKFRDDLVEYVNAGHTELVLKRGDTGNSSAITPADHTEYKGLFLGLESMKSDFKVLTFKMMPQDCLLVYSDCLIESTGKNQEEFGMGRVIESMNRASGAKASEILDGIIKDLYAHTEKENLNDDLTVICIRKL